MNSVPESDMGWKTEWSGLFHSNGERRVNHINTHHIVQADAPALKQDLARETIDKREPDLKEKVAQEWWEQQNSQEVMHNTLNTKITWHKNIHQIQFEMFL